MAISSRCDSQQLLASLRLISTLTSAKPTRRSREYPVKLSLIDLRIALSKLALPGSRRSRPRGSGGVPPVKRLLI
jgi:hypothetical protein